MLERMCLKPKYMRGLDESEPPYIAFALRGKYGIFRLSGKLPDCVSIALFYEPYLNASSCEMIARCNRIMANKRLVKVTWDTKSSEATISVEFVAPNIEHVEQTFIRHCELLIEAAALLFP